MKLGFSHHGKNTVFEKIFMSRIFLSRRDGVAGEWRELHNSELHELEA
jgi:hypothetical protein